MFIDEEDDCESSVKTTLLVNTVDKEIYSLYQELKLAIELMQNKENFEIICSNAINDNINYIISTNYPDKFPEKLALMFFNINMKYNVDINN